LTLGRRGVINAGARSKYVRSSVHSDLDQEHVAARVETAAPRKEAFRRGVMNFRGLPGATHVRGPCHLGENLDARRADAITLVLETIVGGSEIPVHHTLLSRWFLTLGSQQGRGLSNGSINRSISALRRMFYLAKEDEKIRDIPHFPMVKESRPRQGFFERDEYEKLLAALPHYLRLPFSIAYFSGAREGEILGLRWEVKDKDGVLVKQIDFLQGVIRLLETKNDDAREIPIIPQLRTLLMEQYAKRQPDCPYVCFRLDRKGRAVQVRGFR
jgi:integrase